MLNIELPYGSSATPLLSLPKRYKNIRPHKNLYINIWRIIVPNNQKVETIQMLMMYKQNVINHNSRILLNWKSNEVLIHATKWMELENIYAMWEKPYKKSHKLCDSINTKCPKLAMGNSIDRKYINFCLGIGICYNDKWLLLVTGFLFRMIKMFSWSLTVVKAAQLCE